MAEGEQPQERPQRRGGPDLVEQSGHAAVAQQVHVLDRVRAAHHARDQGEDLRRRVHAALRGDLHMFPEQGWQAATVGQRHHRDQPGARHEVRIIEPDADRAAGMG